MQTCNDAKGFIIKMQGPHNYSSSRLSFEAKEFTRLVVASATRASAEHVPEQANSAKSYQSIHLMRNQHVSEPNVLLFFGEYPEICVVNV